MGKVPQRLHEHGVIVIAFEAGRRDGNGLAGIIRDIPLVADIPFRILNRRDHSIQIVRLDLRTFIDHNDFRAVAAHGAHRKAFDFGAVLQGAYAFIPRKLHRPVPVRLHLPHDIRVADEIILNLFDDLCGLLRRAGYHGDQAAGILHADSDAA